MNLISQIIEILGAIGSIIAFLQGISAISKMMDSLKTRENGTRTNINDIIEETELLNKYASNQSLTVILKNKLRNDILIQASKINPYRHIKLVLFIVYFLLAISPLAIAQFLLAQIGRFDANISIIIFSICIVFMLYFILKFGCECAHGYYSICSCLRYRVAYYKHMLPDKTRSACNKISNKLQLNGSNKELVFPDRIRSLKHQKDLFYYEKDISDSKNWFPLIVDTNSRKEINKRLPDGITLITETNFNKIPVMPGCCYVISYFLCDVLLLNKLYKYLIDRGVSDSMIKIVSPLDKNYDWFYRDIYYVYLLHNAKMLKNDTTKTSTL